MIIPATGQRTKIRKRPMKKGTDPLRFAFFVKSCHIDCQPSSKPTPAKKKILPRANKPLSKKRITPRNENRMPNPTRPMPISSYETWGMIRDY
uniref:Uncharacterized protein n=1 Tax=Arundo donax TaxID=35708 RepID=A0A0A8XWF9_ARUDO